VRNDWVRFEGLVCQGRDLFPGSKHAIEVDFSAKVAHKVAKEFDGGVLGHVDIS
jgi:hypothetical protein